MRGAPSPHRRFPSTHETNGGKGGISGGSGGASGGDELVWDGRCRVPVQGAVVEAWAAALTEAAKIGVASTRDACVSWNYKRFVPPMFFFP